MQRAPWPIPLVIVVAGLTGSGVRAADATPAPEQIEFFEKQVRPLLAAHCHRCHGSDKQRGGLRLDSAGALLAGGKSGPAVVPGKPDKSLLIDAVNYRKLEMPPTKKLSARETDLLTKWVAMGAPWPGGTAGPPAPARPPGFQVTDQDRLFWSFRPVARPPVPAGFAMVSANPIDAFIAHKVRDKGLSLSPPAAKRELIRRAFFDLIGLPPTPEEVDAFVGDDRPDAFERLLDRLLSSPQYGERWGRHWLDVVRFAQTNGYERDDEKPNAWRYRDYVIRSFNEDKPYDQFVQEQLAGDELDLVTDDTRTATGFYRLGVWDDEPDDPRQSEFDDLDDMLSTASNAFLGLTLGCARCHDHKFDPIGQEDYYGMLGFVRNIKPYTKPGNDAIKSILAVLEKGGQTLAVHEDGTKVKPTPILVRGSAASPGKEVTPQFVRVLCATQETAVPKLPTASPNGKSTGRRRVLAEWVARGDHPLTARVIVNRLWHYHFGRGIVATPNDFGKTGLAPTHPELLDWLAAELAEGGWRLKRLHKLIMLSATYRQSSRVANEKGLAVDPGNTLLWRQNLRRLEAEAIRDAALGVSGRLNLTMGGRGIFPELPPEVLATQSMPGHGWDKSSAAERSRRSVYIFIKRTLGVPLLETFDFASPDTSAPARTTTTIAPQALILLNSQFMDEQAAAFAGRVLAETSEDPLDQVWRTFRLALGRAPTSREMEVGAAYLERQRARPEATPRQALAALCKVVFNLNEFVYVD